MHASVNASGLGRECIRFHAPRSHSWTDFVRHAVRKEDNYCSFSTSHVSRTPFECRASAQGGRKKRKSGAPLHSSADEPFKGFGSGRKEKISPKQDGEEMPQRVGDNEIINRMFLDAGFLPDRWISNSLRLSNSGTWEVISPIQALEPLFILRPAVCVHRPVQQEPGPQEAAAAALEAGLGVLQRRALRTLPCSAPGWKRLPVILSNLDVDSTQSIREDTMPPLEQEALALLLKHNGHSDGCQDLAATMCRQQLPGSYMGIWPEHALLEHSCMANTNVMVVQDRMVVRAVAPVAPGQTLTTNHIAGCVLQAYQHRQEAVRERGRPSCRCRRCGLEAALPPKLTASMAAFNAAGAAVVSALRNGPGPEAKEAGRHLHAVGSSCYTALREAMPSAKDRALMEPSLYMALQGRLLYTDLVEQNLDTRPLEACLSALELVMNGSEQHVMLAVELLRRMELLSRREEARSKRGVLGQLIQKAQATSIRAIRSRYGNLPDSSYEQILRALFVGAQMGGANGEAGAGGATAAGMAFQVGDPGPFTESELETLFDEAEDVEEGDDQGKEGRVNIEDMGLENVLDLDDLLKEAEGYMDGLGEGAEQVLEHKLPAVDASQAVIDVHVVNAGRENGVAEAATALEFDFKGALLDEVLQQLDNDQLELMMR